MIKGFIQFEQNDQKVSNPFECEELIELKQYINFLEMGGIKDIKVVFKGSTISRKVRT